MSAAPSDAAPRGRLSFYYGWWIVLAAGIGHFASVSFAAVLLAVMLRPMTEEFGWTRAEFTFASSIAALLVAAVGLVIGPMIDRHGGRPLMLAGSVVYGASLLATAFITDLWQFIALQLIAGGLARPLVGGLVANVTVAKWFVVRRGWAISLASSGFSFGTMLMPVIATLVVTSVGWRDAFIVMAVLFWVLTIPAALLLRRRPEDHGWLPDGRRPGDADTEQGREHAARVQQDFDQSFTRAEAMRTAAFWLLLVAFSLSLASNLAMIFHAIPFATGSGFSDTQAGFAFGLTGISGLASKFSWAWALQRWAPQRLSGLAFAIAGSGTLLLLAATATTSIPLLVVAFLLWGFGFGGYTPLVEYMWAAYFGRRHLGAVRSVGVVSEVIAAAVGPLIVAFWFDLAGAYEGAFVGMAALYLAGLVAVVIARRPVRPIEAPTG